MKRRAAARLSWVGDEIRRAAARLSSRFSACFPVQMKGTPRNYGGSPSFEQVTRIELALSVWELSFVHR